LDEVEKCLGQPVMDWPKIFDAKGRMHNRNTAMIFVLHCWWGIHRAFMWRSRNFQRIHFLFTLCFPDVHLGLRCS
jgi:hypothetical protein